jgi:hypothetical protein
MASTAYSRGTGILCEGAFTSNVGLGWVGLGIHQGVHVFLVLLVGFQGGMVQSFDFGFVFCLLR